MMHIICMWYNFVGQWHRLCSTVNMLCINKMPLTNCNSVYKQWLQAAVTNGCLLKLEQALAASTNRPLFFGAAWQTATGDRKKLNYFGQNNACLAMVKKSYIGPLKKAIQLHGRKASSPEASSEEGTEQEQKCQALGLFLNNLCSTLSPLPTDRHKQRNPNSLTPFA